MTEAAFLKEELGPVLARGIAEVVATKPRDPVEFLGRWLLHYLEEKERAVDAQKRTLALEKEKEEWTQTRIEREKFSSSIIQREWKSHIAKSSERKRKESELAEHFQNLSAKADEQFVVDDAALPEGGGEKSEAEKESELARIRGDIGLNRAKLFLNGLTKENIADVKGMGAPSPIVVRIIRSVFYLMARQTPRQIDSWQKIHMLIKPFPFLEWMKGYGPVGAPLEKKRKICRVRRLLKKYTDEEVKASGGGIVVFVIYQWLQALVTMRDTRDSDIKLLKSLGKEVGDQEYEEEEVLEDEEKDAEEEKVRKAEEEEAKAAEEAARKEKEGGAAEGAAEE